MTLRLPVDAVNPSSPVSHASLTQAAAILRGGGIVAFPTETVYGLAAHALDTDAVAKIFAAKQRPTWDPLIVHIVSRGMLDQVAAFVSAADRTLIEAFWPGPLTLLLPKTDAVPAAVTADRPKVGVRMPAHPVARALIEISGLPLAAPSANSFGRISPTTAQHVLEDLDGRIDAVLDGGPTSLGLESTVLDANTDPPVLYRPGMISMEALRQYLPGITAFAEPATAPGGSPAALPSPGVGLRHYAPRARLILVDDGQFPAALAAAAATTGVLLPEGFDAPENVPVFYWGRWSDMEQLAQRLFAGLRALDSMGVEEILCPLPATAGLGAALRDRLAKAAKPKD